MVKEIITLDRTFKNLWSKIDKLVVPNKFMLGGFSPKINARVEIAIRATRVYGAHIKSHQHG